MSFRRYSTEQKRKAAKGNTFRMTKKKIKRVVRRLEIIRLIHKFRIALNISVKLWVIMLIASIGLGVYLMFWLMNLRGSL